MSASASDLVTCAKTSLFRLLNLVCTLQLDEHQEPMACENQSNSLACALCEAVTGFGHDRTKMTRHFVIFDPVDTKLLTAREYNPLQIGKKKVGICVALLDSKAA